MLPKEISCATNHREILCVGCDHKPICKFTTDFMAAQKIADNFQQNPNIRLNPQCDFFKQSCGTPRIIKEG